MKAPDLMVVKGVSHPEERRSFKVGEERVVPSVIFEITSEKTQREDTEAKPNVYAALGVPEYFLFDPTGDYLDPPLCGYRLEGDRYAPIPPNPTGDLESLQIGWNLRVEGAFVRFADPMTNARMVTYVERGLASIRRQKMIEDLTGELAASEKLLEKERRKTSREAKKAETERQKAEAERQKAEVERQKTANLEAEVKRLRALLGESESGAGT